MRYWLQLPQAGWVATRENVRVYATLAEELGLHGVWLGDHIVIPFDYTSQYPYGSLHPVPPDRPFLEAYTTLAFVAGLTNKVRLAVTVAIAPYRHPLLHAKVVATLDVLSGGRLEVAVGSGWLREEFEALGADFPRRQKVTDEYLEAMRMLWAGEPVTFDGETVAFARVQCLPRPAQKPHPPLWIGGSGNRAFERMERFNAGWLGPDLALSEFLEKLAAFRGRCASLGRELPGVSAKVWVEPAEQRAGDSLSISHSGGANLSVLAKLAEDGVSDIRVDLSRLPSGERPQHILGVSRTLRKEGLLDGG
ncbi:MAG: TIGR03619 family F420-dependent LLM class oxidoreductase [Candidatus Dormibacter sp.]